MFQSEGMLLFFACGSASDVIYVRFSFSLLPFDAQLGEPPESQSSLAQVWHISDLCPFFNITQVLNGQAPAILIYLGMFYLRPS